MTDLRNTTSLTRKPRTPKFNSGYLKPYNTKLRTEQIKKIKDNAKLRGVPAAEIVREALDQAL